MTPICKHCDIGIMPRLCGVPSGERTHCEPSRKRLDSTIWKSGFYCAGAGCVALSCVLFGIKDYSTGNTTEMLINAACVIFMSAIAVTEFMKRRRL